jgi:hypothetical protein
LPLAEYHIQARANGFKTQIVEHVRVDVARIAQVDFQLEVGSASEIVNVTAMARCWSESSISVGQIINERTTQELPLNGRHFIDLALLVPGSVTPPQKRISLRAGSRTRFSGT